MEINASSAEGSTLGAAFIGKCSKKKKIRISRELGPGDTRITLLFHDVYFEADLETILTLGALM